VRKTVKEAEESRAPQATLKALKTALTLMQQSEKLVRESGEWFCDARPSMTNGFGGSVPPGAKWYQNGIRSARNERLR
jgi:hypothetical protein